MRISKIVIGILSIVASAAIMLQSFAVSFFQMFSQSKDAFGAIAFIVIAVFLAAGITSLAGRYSHKASLACSLLHLFAWFVGKGYKGPYTDLLIYVWLSLALAITYAAFSYREYQIYKYYRDTPEMPLYRLGD